MLGMYVHMYTVKSKCRNVSSFDVSWFGKKLPKYNGKPAYPTGYTRIVKSKTQPLFWSGWASCKNISKHFFFKELFLIGFVIRLVKTAELEKFDTFFSCDNKSD